MYADRVPGRREKGDGKSTYPQINVPHEPGSSRVLRDGTDGADGDSVCPGSLPPAFSSWKVRDGLLRSSRMCGTGGGKRSASREDESGDVALGRVVQASTHVPPGRDVTTPARMIALGL